MSLKGLPKLNNYKLSFKIFIKEFEKYSLP